MSYTYFFDGTREQSVYHGEEHFVGRFVWVNGMGDLDFDYMRVYIGDSSPENDPESLHCATKEEAIACIKNFFNEMKNEAPPEYNFSIEYYNIPSGKNMVDDAYRRVDEEDEMSEWYHLWGPNWLQLENSKVSS